MKIDAAKVKYYALRELQYNTHDPVDATIRGIQSWLNEMKLEIKPKPSEEASDDKGIDASVD